MGDDDDDDEDRGQDEVSAGTTSVTSHPHERLRRLQRDAHLHAWTLARDDELAATLAALDRHFRTRVQRVARAVDDLDRRAARASVRAATEHTEFLLRHDAQFVDHRVRDDESARGDDESARGDDDDDEHQDDDDDDGTGDAVREGMRALRLFLDPASLRPMRRLGGGTSHHDGDHGVLLDSCYYYDSVEGDGFNHRPLPYVVGSTEFRRSNDAGLGITVEEQYDKTVFHDDVFHENDHLFNFNTITNTITKPVHPTEQFATQPNSPQVDDNPAGLNNIINELTLELLLNSQDDAKSHTPILSEAHVEVEHNDMPESQEDSVVLEAHSAAHATHSTEELEQQQPPKEYVVPPLRVDGSDFVYDDDATAVNVAASFMGDELATPPPPAELPPPPPTEPPPPPPPGGTL